MDLSSAVRVAGRGAAAFGVVAAGAAVGVLAERTLVRRSALSANDEPQLGALRGEVRDDRKDYEAVKADFVASSPLPQE